MAILIPAGPRAAAQAKNQRPGRSIPALGNTIVLGWNDLGMHCMNQNYGNFCILPPYNNLSAQVIRRGDPPQLLDSAVTLSYRFPANTTSAGKIDFWTYAQGLFGVTLAPNVGLTGNGLAGSMTWNTTDGLFQAIGVPLTPFEDATPTTMQPYQMAEVTLKSGATGLTLDTTNFVAPVSVELNCGKCHSAPGKTVEEVILNVHEDANLPSLKPVLCASCHSSNALGTVGRPGLPSLSLALHGKHAELGTPPACYDCHPGKTTQCLRDAMFMAGKRCEDCHGTIAQVASSIRAGRRPWLDEPKCETCHGASHAEEPGKLYRKSKGHGGLACEACHNSPHAILPTVQPRDAVQVQRVQGSTTYIKDCRVCHTTEPLAPGPHGVLTGWRIANHLSGVAPLTGADLQKADYNFDGKVDIADVIYQINRGL